MSIKSDFKVTSGLTVTGNSNLDGNANVTGKLLIKGSTGTAGQVLVSGGVDADPIWGNIEDYNVDINSLWTWGSNSYGQLGDNTIILKSTPVQPICYGTNWNSVSGGYECIAAIKTDGTLWTCGYNDQGQLGDDTIIKKSSPVQTVAGGNNWSKVDCGRSHIAAIKTDGTLWTWGGDTYGQLGNSSTISRSSPIQIMTGGNNWKEISCGTYCAAAIKTDGTLWLWGMNNYGQLGDGTNSNKSSPVQTTTGGNNWKEISLGNNHTAAIKTDGTLWTWGGNSQGQLGHNTLDATNFPLQAIVGSTNWSKVSCGTYHTAAIKTDGTLWTWGYNIHGQLGINNQSSRILEPVQTISGGVNWNSISCGNYHTSAIKTDGSLWIWGMNGQGQLGDNTNLNKSSPIQTISGGTNWKSVSCGGDFTAAITF